MEKTLTNMKKLITTLPLVAVMTSLALVGCIVDSTPIAPVGDVDVLLRLRTPGDFSERATRALDAGGENAIRDIHVLVFDQEGRLSSVKTGTPLETVVHDDPGATYSGEGRFEVTLPASREGETNKLVVLANLGAVAAITGEGGTLAGLGGKSYDEVVASLSVSITGPLYAGALPNTHSIPMWGETDYIEIRQDLSITALDLTRAVARIDVGVGQPNEAGSEWNGRKASGGEIPFTLTSVHVMRPGNRYAIIPDPDSFEAGLPTIVGDTDPDVVSFSVADSKTLFGYTTTPNGYTTREIYIPEANIIQGGTPGDERHEERMALVVGGIYNGSTQYYRVDFIDGASGELIDVVRNNLYQFNIADVVGSGATTPELAYANPSMNIEVRIVSWTPLVFEDVKIVRDRYFSLSRRSPFYLPSLKGGSETLTIETNIESFTMTLGGNTLSSAGGTVTTSNFSYTLAGSGGTYTLTIETRNDNLGEPEHEPSDTWAVDADGIIEFDYTVRQGWSLYDPTPHAITVTATTGGTTRATHASAPQGTSVKVWAQPDGGYAFAGWTLTSPPAGFTLTAAQMASPELPFTMPAGAVALAANFAAAILTATADENDAPWKPAERYTTGGEEPAEGDTGPRTITVTANVPWTATLSDDDNFAIAGSSSGTANGSFTVFPTTTNDDPTAAARTLTVMVSGGGITIPVILTHAAISGKDFDFTGEPDDWNDKDLDQRL